jgi:site-specific recombinase XerD
MASLYKKPILVTDPKTGKKGNGKSRKWWGRYRDENGIDKRVPLATDKMAAQAMLSELVRKVELKIAGLEDPYDQHRKRPLIDHLADFHRFLEGRGNTEKHSRQTCNRAQAIIEGCHFDRLKNVSPSAVVEWLKNERAAGRLGIKSSNYYLGCIKSFFAWMVKDRRTDCNPLSHLAGMNARVESGRVRRFLSEEEFALFLAAARNGKPIRNVSGIDRVMLYILGANSGFRCSELASLTPESFSLNQGTPCVTVDAAYSKRRREDIQPLPDEVAAILRPWLKEKPAQRKLWPGTWANHAAKMVRLDLAAAREKWIRDTATPQEQQDREASSFLVYRDQAGRVFDFHSLRHQYISNLAAAGVHPKTAQTLARHSTITLTMDLYTHLGLCDLSSSVNVLPSVFGKVENVEACSLRPTGTENGGSCEVPTVVPRGAKNGAIQPASVALRFAPDCTQRTEVLEKPVAVSPRRIGTTGTDPPQITSICTGKERGNKKGPSRIRTGDGGFAIRCLSRLAKGPSLPIVPILSAWQRPNLTRKMPQPTSPRRPANSPAAAITP